MGSAKIPAVSKEYFSREERKNPRGKGENWGERMGETLEELSRHKEKQDTL